MKKRLSATLLSLMVLSAGLVGCGSSDSSEPKEAVVEEKSTEITLERVFDNPSILSEMTEMEVDFSDYINNLEAEVKVFTIEGEEEKVSEEIKIFSNTEDLTSLELFLEEGVVTKLNLDEFNGIIDETPYKGSFLRYDYMISERYNEFDKEMLPIGVGELNEKYLGKDIQNFWDDFKVIIPDSKIVNTENNMTLEIYTLDSENTIILQMDGSTVSGLTLNEDINLDLIK
jgi:hypothetical protein